MKYLKICFISWLFSLAQFVIAANVRDSLLNVYNTSSSDSIRFKAIDDYVWEFMYENPDTACTIAGKAFISNNKTQYKKGLALLLRTMGASHVLRGDNEKGIYYYTLSAKITGYIKDDEGQASSFNGLGIIYSRQGNYSKAIEQYLSSLASYERLNDKEGMSIAYNNIGLNYERQTQFEKAMSYYKKTLNLKNEIGKPLGIAQAKINVGNVYSSMKKFDQALYHYNDALALQKQLNNPSIEAAINNSIGVVYLEQKKYASATDYFMRALVLRIKLGDKYSAIDIRNNLALIHNYEKNYKKAIEYALESHTAAMEMQNMEMIKQTANTLSYAYEHLGNPDDALKYYKIFENYKDSLYNKENTEKSIQAELQYEFSKQAEKAKLIQEKKELEQKEAVKRQSIIRNFLLLGFLLLSIVVFLIYRNLKQKQKANNELQKAYSQIEEKSTLLEEKNKEVMDSIKYAKRLQEAILPANDFIQLMFPEHFVLYKPKDIVSGDFYWFEQYGNKKLFSAVDCTGHGVPGAFMSIVGYNLLNQAVNEHGLTRPNLILNELNKGITKTLKQTQEESTVKDGMDIALCSFDPASYVLEYAGAYNSLWYIRDGKIEEVKADKQPIGLFVGEELKSFTNNAIQLQKGDTVFVFTDGYADQFGGEKGKKFKYKKLQELLLTIAHLSMQEQKEKLNETIEKWRGGLEQVDDILIIGIRV
ncbi:MAG: tetratricopeptide repeat protein [Bacteroidetes bacterium]|nr:tetratricopeptide repeat protein [Bacteroidota bacterium]